MSILMPRIRQCAFFGLIGVLFWSGVLSRPRSAQAQTAAACVGSAQDNNIFWNGLFADQGPLYQQPTEPTAAQSVTVMVRACHNDLTSANVKYYDTADSSFHYVPLSVSGQDVTGNFDFWQGAVLASPSEKYYRFQLNDGSATTWLNAGGLYDSAHEPSSNDFWIVPSFHTPTWSKHAIYYQIFPDRFKDGNAGNNLTFTASGGPIGPTGGVCPTGSYLYGNDCAYQHTAWTQLPENPPNGEDFFGGDLAGIDQEIIPYLNHTLGVNAIYLNPIFESPSNHKYDTQDYTLVDPHFGTNADLQTLIGDAHTNGMSVLLDGVFNHVSDWHEWFNDQAINYGVPGAYQSQSSPFYDRFYFLPGQWPAGYCNWSGYTSLVKLNYASTNLRNDIYRSSTSVMQTYLSPPYNADGWRYDVADNLVSITSAPDTGSCGGTDDHAIWQDIRPYVKGTAAGSIVPNGAEKLMLGEYWQVASPWFNGNEWDAVMNYNGFNFPVSKWLTCVEVHGENPGCLKPSDLSNWLVGTLANIPRQAQLSMMNSLTTHDTARFLYRTGYRASAGSSVGSPDPTLLKLGIMLQMTYVGAPSIYYGDEIGMTGGNDPDNRRPFIWDQNQWDLGVLNLYQRLTWARKTYSAFTDGSFKPLVADDANNLFAYGRWDANNWAIVALNNDANPHSATIDAYQLSIPNGTVLTDVMTGATYTVSDGEVDLPSGVLPGHGGVVLIANTAGGVIPTATNTPTNTGTPTNTSTPTATPTSTSTPTPTNTSTNTPTATPTNTPVPPRIDSIGIFRSGTFYLRLHNSTGNADLTVTFNPATKPYPVVGDWTGAGFDAVGAVDQSNGLFSLCNANVSATCANNANITHLVLGNPNDQPLGGKWTSGFTHFGVGVFRPSNGLIYLKNNLVTGFADDTMVLGVPGDAGLAGDWNGDGLDSPGVYRPSNSTFYLTNQVCNCSATGSYQFAYGIGGDAPAIGDWSGQGHAGVGLFRQSNGFTYLRNNLTTGFADITFTYGIAGDIPVAGHWQVIYPPAPKPGSVLVPPTAAPLPVQGGGLRD